MNKSPHNPLLLFLTIGAGILVFVAASGDSIQALLAIPVWLASWIVSYGPGGVPMPRAGIILAVLGTTAYMLLRVMVAPTSELVLNISTYLLWLQVIKLYDRTTPRDLAQLLVMSFALVVGACLLGSSLLFGVFLLVHVVMGLTCAATLQFHAGESRRVGYRPESERLHRLSGMAMRSRRIVYVSIVGVLVLSSGIFVVLPRGMKTDFYEGLLSGDTLEVSFDDQVELGSAGLLSDSQKVVLDLTLKDIDGVPIETLQEPIYLRGAVLDEYNAGRWTASNPPRWSTTTRLFIQPDSWSFINADRSLPAYVQTIELHDKQKQQIFSMPGPIGLDRVPPGRVQWASTTQLISLPDSDGRISYTVVSQPSRPGVNPERNPRLPRLVVGTNIHDEMLNLLTQWQLTRDPEEWFVDIDIRISKLLESHLRSRCSYTTELIAPEPGEDPIEMFLFRTREGHCEYFASSMAAMLRSIGVDARVVTGYMVRETRLGGGTFVARENDAHAWVEVQHTPGIWTTYDPSPPSDLDALHRSPMGFAKLWSDVRDSILGFWARSVIGYDQMRQQNMLGGWIANFEEYARKKVLSSGEGLSAVPLKALVNGLLYGVIAFSGVALLGVGSRLGLRQIRDWLATHWRHVRHSSGRSTSLSLQRVSLLYSKAEGQLRRAGVQRPRWMTPMQFAQTLEDRDSALATSMSLLASLHYKAVFSQAQLEPDAAERAGVAFRYVKENARGLRSSRKKLS
jgi:protein-glutamine gamma-glutamyltransferase